MARRRPPDAPVAPDELWVPDYLLAGPCCEVWTPERRPVTAAEWPLYSIAVCRRHRNARSAWFTVHGLDSRTIDTSVPLTLRHSHGPWSYSAWRERDPEGLAAALTRWGLPPDWTPAPAPRLLMDLPPYGPVPPAAAALLLNA